MMTRWGVSVGAALLLGGFVGFCEEITLSTYYPSPRGVYDELRANRLILVDRTTKQEYGLTIDESRLLVTDVSGEKTFLLFDLGSTGRR